MCRITFITPTLNRNPRIVERCLRCVTNQTIADWEQIVCSDGKREPAIERLIEGMGDPRRRYLHLPRFLGQYASGVRDAMIDVARGDYLAFLDDDNIVFPKYAASMIDALDRNPEAGFAICQLVECRPLPQQPRRGPFVINGIPPAVRNIDSLQVVARREAMRKSRWCRTGYLSDGHTYEKLACEHSWIPVDAVLGLHV